MFLGLWKSSEVLITCLTGLDPSIYSMVRGEYVVGISFPKIRTRTGGG